MKWNVVGVSYKSVYVFNFIYSKLYGKAEVNASAFGASSYIAMAYPFDFNFGM